MHIRTYIDTVCISDCWCLLQDVHIRTHTHTSIYRRTHTHTYTHITFQGHIMCICVYVCVKRPSLRLYMDTHKHTYMYILMYSYHFSGAPPGYDSYDEASINHPHVCVYVREATIVATIHEIHIHIRTCVHCIIFQGHRLAMIHMTKLQSMHSGRPWSSILQSEPSYTYT